MEREIDQVTRLTNRPWGIGFLSWGARAETVERSLEHEPDAVMLSFGDPGVLASW